MADSQPNGLFQYRLGRPPRGFSPNGYNDGRAESTCSPRRRMRPILHGSQTFPGMWCHTYGPGRTSRGIVSNTARTKAMQQLLCSITDCSWCRRRTASPIGALRRAPCSTDLLASAPALQTVPAGQSAGGDQMKMAARIIGVRAQLGPATRSSSATWEDSIRTARSSAYRGTGSAAPATQPGDLTHSIRPRWNWAWNRA